MPISPLPPPKRASIDSFRLVGGILDGGEHLVVLDERREPHLVRSARRAGSTTQRVLPHVLAERDSLRPVAVAMHATSQGRAVVVLDARRQRLLSVDVGDAGFRRHFVQLDLRGVLDRSDNPQSIGAAPWGIALAGVMTGGTRVAYSRDLRSWEKFRDTASVRFGFPVTSFARSLAGSSLVLLHPNQQRAMLASAYHRSLWILDLRNATSRVLQFDSTTRAPARLRRAADSSVRLTWDGSVRRHFMGAAASSDYVALLDCDCRARDETPDDQTLIWLVDWQGELIALLKAPTKLVHVGFGRDGRELLAAAKDGPWQRIVSWDLDERILRHRRAGAVSSAVKIAQSEKDNRTGDIP
ncbi:MAG TPA: hypothetical protein VEA99_07195 [Gemmatimonadaceae bacterium]|nr:hypothetical protein [Gemmatimonadaceae bacterium]